MDSADEKVIVSAAYYVFMSCAYLKNIKKKKRKKIQKEDGDWWMVSLNKSRSR